MAWIDEDIIRIISVRRAKRNEMEAHDEKFPYICKLDADVVAWLKQKRRTCTRTERY